MSSGRARTSRLIAQAAAVGLRIDSIPGQPGLLVAWLSPRALLGRNSSGCSRSSSCADRLVQVHDAPYAGPASDGATCVAADATGWPGAHARGEGRCRAAPASGPVSPSREPADRWSPGGTAEPPAGPGPRARTSPSDSTRHIAPTCPERRNSRWKPSRPYAGRGPCRASEAATSRTTSSPTRHCSPTRALGDGQAGGAQVLAEQARRDPRDRAVSTTTPHPRPRTRRAQSACRGSVDLLVTDEAERTDRIRPWRTGRLSIAVRWKYLSRARARR